MEFQRTSSGNRANSARSENAADGRAGLHWNHRQSGPCCCKFFFSKYRSFRNFVPFYSRPSTPFHREFHTDRNQPLGETIWKSRATKTSNFEIILTKQMLISNLILTLFDLQFSYQTQILPRSHQAICWLQISMTLELRVMQVNHALELQRKINLSPAPFSAYLQQILDETGNVHIIDFQIAFFENIVKGSLLTVITNHTNRVLVDNDSWKFIVFFTFLQKYKVYKK